jgi:hypothetical protein
LISITQIKDDHGSRYYRIYRLYYNLTEEEIQNPYTLIIDSFSWDSLPQQLARLKYWRDLLLVEEYYDKRDCPADLYFQYKMIVRILEAAWLLRKKAPSGVIVRPDSEGSMFSSYLKTEYESIPYYPTFLGPEEIENPYGVFKTTFTEFQLRDYRNIMDRWFSQGLTTFYCESILEKKEVITVYENLQKLIEAMYLVY